MGKTSTRPSRHRTRRAVACAVKILRGQLSDPSPEQCLWLAVIEQAVREAHGWASSDPERRAHARAWLGSEEFAEVAGALGLHPRWTRDTIGMLERLGDAGASDEGPSPCLAASRAPAREGLGVDQGELGKSPGRVKEAESERDRESQALHTRQAGPHRGQTHQRPHSKLAKLFDLFDGSDPVPWG